MDNHGESASSSSRRNTHAHIAPRADVRAVSAREPGRPPRLSHRSRAGCWTCRGRKVKCDEQKPRCGPCTRLNRECDWDHRWNFSDATSSTQDKYSNVTTTGNSVWDPAARLSPTLSPSSPQYDVLPAFAILTNDEDRERKAETHRPGTFSVVATPDSFSSLPEYAATGSSLGRRESVQSMRCSTSSPAPTPHRILSRADPNTVVLERFEEAGPSLASPSRDHGFPESMQQLSISTPTQSAHLPFTTAPLQRVQSADDQFLVHFRRYIAPRVIQPSGEGSVSDPGSTTNLFEDEAARFPPLHSAICALSALNLSNNGRVSLEEALQYYQKALSVPTTPKSSDSLLSDGVFLRHFLLFVYDICVPSDGDSMWTQHLNHLGTIAVQRHQRLGHEPYGYILWTICQLDIEACLLGSGNCEFMRIVLQNGMLPRPEQQIPGPITPGEAPLFKLVQRLDESIVIQLSQIAELAQRLRAEAATGKHSPGSTARWQAAVSRTQTELFTTWNQAYPEHLRPESPQAGALLPPQVRYVFEHAFVLYQTAVIYSRTSMFLGQRMIPVANQADIHADTECRCASILALASKGLQGGDLILKRHVLFPLFIAGIATTQSDAKVQTVDIIKAIERGAISTNTNRARNLLLAVYEEQRNAVSMGGRMEQVDWLAVARARGLTVVNCGL